MRLTCQEAWSDEWGINAAVNLCAGDPRFYGFANQAIVRLLPRGQWRGTVVRYRVCVSRACLTWPRQIESILAWAMCGQGGTIRSHYYEFLGYGPGQFTTCGSHNGGSSGCSFSGAPCGSGNDLADRGLAVAFDDICGTGKKIRVYCDLPAADVGKTILLQGLDQYANPVLTDGGNINGELVTLALPYVDTITTWFPGGLTGVQKEATKGPVRLYELDTATALQRLLAVYEPDETLPEYRRSIVPGVACGGSADCAQSYITVLAKLKFVAVKAPTDYLLISNPAALKDMFQSVKKRQDNLISEAIAYEQSAVAELERELANFHGDGTSDPVATINTAQYGGGLESLI